MATTHPFADAPIIYRITRQQLIEDGTLVVDFDLDGKQVDINQLAREAGITFPIALTAELFADVCNPPPSQSHQDVTGRLWDLLWMSRRAIAYAVNVCRDQKRTEYSLHYKLIMHVGRKTYYTVKLHIGPGDDGKLVVTLMKPGQD